MKKKLILSLFMSASLIYCIGITSVWGNSLSSQETYKQIQGYIVKNDWGAVYDSLDQPTKEFVDAITNTNLIFLYGYDNELPEDFKNLSGKDKYIKMVDEGIKDQKIQLIDEGASIAFKYYGLVNPKDEIIKVETIDTLAKITIKNVQGKENDVIMILENSEWKLHIPQNQYTKEIIDASKSGDMQKAYQLIANSAIEGMINNNIQSSDKQTGKELEAMLINKKDKKDQLLQVIRFISYAQNYLEPKKSNAITEAKNKINSLLSEGTDINAETNGTPFLVDGIMYGLNQEIIGFLISKGADVNAKDQYAKTVLIHAATIGNKDIVELLIAKGADINMKDDTGSTALIAAAAAFPYVASPVNIESEDDALIAKGKGHKEVINLLMSKGANINERDNQGTTALMVAASCGEKDIVELLISKGADVNITDNEGRTALTYVESAENVSKSNKKKIIELLRSKEKLSNSNQ